MQPIQGATPRPPGEPASTPSAAGEQPLSTQQRTVLERLITRIIALSQQQSAEVWAGLKHDLGLKSETPLLSRHFPAAEQNLNQRLTSAQTTLATRQIIQQFERFTATG
ncbi:Flagellar regulator flk [Cedecea neteri]|uniref:Flagellar regulator flk n=1 Tax=Cedecea neteri TaxID=158822 RepID=A0A2X3J855_9ENTR|nr:Flagellar regulator flk [Cedecea neteri]